MTDHDNPHPDPDPDDSVPEGDDEPLTVERILAAAGAGEALDRLPQGDSQASRLVGLALLHYELVHGSDGRPYAVEPAGPAVAWPLRGQQGLAGRLRALHYDTYQQAPSSTAISDALGVLEARAERADTVPVALRVARAAERSLVVDLGGVDGRCVLVEPGGWRIIGRSPVLFRRSPLTAELPDPVPDAGGLDELRRLINVDEARWRLLVAWLVAALIPDIPHPILGVFGEQGTAKSTATRLLVELIDPSPAPLRSPPRELRSWASAARASWVVALDNISSIPAWLSDTLCKAVTGDGVVERVLHTDDDVNVLTFRRVIALTSIDAGRLAGDLAERLLPVELDPIPPVRRRTDAEIADKYQHVRPRALGALLDLSARVLDTLPAVQLDQLPRMADFARILAALDQLHSWSTLADYTAAADDAALAVLEADPVAQAIREMLGRAGGWQGTASQLLDKITPDQPPRDWPRTARGLSGALKRLAPALRVAGITVERPARGQDRTITLRAGQPDPDPRPENA